MKTAREWSTIVLSILSLAGVIVIYIAGSTASAKVAPIENRVTALEAQPLSPRVSTLEAHRQDDAGRLDRIENKIDALNAKIDRVLAR